jgi:hypothetical protein
MFGVTAEKDFPLAGARFPVAPKGKTPTLGVIQADGTTKGDRPFGYAYWPDLRDWNPPKQ